MTSSGSRFEKFSEEARKVLSFAQEQAKSLNHGYIGTEHVFLGLINENECIATKCLVDLAVDLFVFVLCHYSISQLSVLKLS